ncbi:hypothetical protein SBX64_16135 [Vibrio rhizosphaerae]|uniref:Uncharacterized protein n=1 Tax=Vibrio rhizosphaerae TaxID=398736 RepID=A0ABU4J0M9_9VIBR|nr:hypothetical protein [Vibrio rhizosphaerae]MDW6094069.1 hypothetical protein [Vibrio rhizosphaerae]
MIESIFRPAEELRNISQSVTSKLLEEFVKAPETKGLYIDTEIRIAAKLEELAEGGFFDAIEIRIFRPGSKSWTELSDINKEIFKDFLMKSLTDKGYMVKDLSESSLELRLKISFSDLIENSVCSHNLL